MREGESLKLRGPTTSNPDCLAKLPHEGLYTGRAVMDRSQPFARLSEKTDFPMAARWRADGHRHFSILFCRREASVLHPPTKFAPYPKQIELPKVRRPGGDRHRECAPSKIFNLALAIWRSRCNSIRRHRSPPGPQCPPRRTEPVFRELENAMKFCGANWHDESYEGTSSAESRP